VRRLDLLTRISSLPNPAIRTEEASSRRIPSSTAHACNVARALSFASLVIAFAFPLASQQTGAATKPEADPPLVRAQKICIQSEAAFILNRDRTKARQGFLSATQVDHRYAPAWFDLAVLAEGDKEWVDAAADFRHYLSLQPTGPDADRAKAQLQLLPKYISGAVTPGGVRSMEYDASIQRARAFLAHGFYKESIAEAGHAQSLDPSRWEAYAVVSLCMARQNKKQEATKFEALAVNHAPVSKRDQVRAALSSHAAQ
jgi:hypothetical protein